MALVVVGRYALSVSRCPFDLTVEGFPMLGDPGSRPSCRLRAPGLFSESVGHHRTYCSVVSRRPSAWVALRCPSLGSFEG